MRQQLSAFTDLDFAIDKTERTNLNVGTNDSALFHNGSWVNLCSFVNHLKTLDVRISVEQNRPHHHRPWPRR
ncbi:Uncharacterised protein [Vibrio cholerae]|nr:Uncharacterised protein [Vibrio cholerae]